MNTSIRTCTVVVALLLTLCPFGPHLARAAEPLDEVRAAIASSSGQRWVLRRITRFLGKDERRCKAGEEWTLWTDGRLAIERCVDGKLQLTRASWTLEQEGALDIILVTGTARYVVMPLSRTASGGLQLRLRVRPSEPSVQTKDLVFVDSAAP